VSDDSEESSWILVIREPSNEDREFIAALKAMDNPREWNERAIAARTTRLVFGALMPREIESLDHNGLSRAHTDEERAAWRFGFDWKPAG
jgi:hypothetical protein